MKVTYRKILIAAHDNDTWLAPYAYDDVIVKLIEWNNGKKHIEFHGERYDNVHGTKTAGNDWDYKIKQILSDPLENGEELFKQQETINPCAH